MNKPKFNKINAYIDFLQDAWDRQHITYREYSARGCRVGSHCVDERIIIKPTHVVCLKVPTIGKDPDKVIVDTTGEWAEWYCRDCKIILQETRRNHNPGNFGPGASR